MRKEFYDDLFMYETINNTYYCSHCRHYAYESQRFNFCQDCGADMREFL